MESRPGRPTGIPPSMRTGAHSHPTAHPQAAPQHRPATPPPPPMPPKKSKVPFVVGVIALAVIAIVMVAAAITMLWRSVSINSAVSSKDYQAVFLSNNMVYFGKLSNVNDEYVKMTNIFYLQVQGQQNGQTQNNTSQQPQLSLTKLGNELHGPEDSMYINKKEILFWENLKPDGKVSQAILDYQNKNGK